MYFAQIFAQVTPVYSNEFINDESEDGSFSDDYQMQWIMMNLIFLIIIKMVIFWS